jgi:ferric-dicitrate binding protein FerR (iron transport regulator)
MQPALRVALVAAAALCPLALDAQTSGCTLTTLSDPSREVLHCADGLTISAERGAAYRLVDRNRDGRPEAVELTDRAILIDKPSGRRGGGFQILTPHAIASVRGTQWAVDVGATRTSVFVERGVVGVRKPGLREVALRAGEGVDVDEGATSLEVKTWAPARAAALLARLRP